MSQPIDKLEFKNPFRPGAGHRPPYLAGRISEKHEFEELLKQDVILKNLVLTGLRGVGKTVLLDELKGAAFSKGWAWCGSDLSEATMVSEDRLANRLLADLAGLVAPLKVPQHFPNPIGFVTPKSSGMRHLGYEDLKALYERTPGGPTDKLRDVIIATWDVLKTTNVKGVVLAYDEAQNLSDNADSDEYPLSVFLDLFQSIQRRDIPMMLVFCGLPTLFPKLVKSRTYAERMFRVLELKKLNKEATREAIEKPFDLSQIPIRFTDTGISEIAKHSGGYPYFIQFFCRECLDVAIQQAKRGEKVSTTVAAFVPKLDSEFFAGRWANLTTRQRDLLHAIAQLPSCEGEFSPTDIVEQSKQLTDANPFSIATATQTISKLLDQGILYRTRHGKYCFAVPLMSGFIRRQIPT